MKKEDFLNKTHSLLEKWSSVSYKFETFRDDEIKDLDVEKIEIVKESFESIQLFNSYLLVEHPIISTNIEYRNFCIFFNNLIASKIKYSFFREDSIKSFNKLNNKYVETIYYIAHAIVTEESNDKLKFLISKYYFLSFLMYDFIFDAKNGNGYFTNFQQNKDEFFQIKDDILDLLNEITTESQYRDLSVRVIPYTISKNQKINISIENDDFEKFFSTFIVNYQNKIKLEPFSYLISNILWKTGHLFQDIFDHKEIDIAFFVDNIKQILDVCSEFYNTNKIAYEKLFDSTQNMFQKLNILLEPTSRPLETNLSQYKIAFDIKESVTTTITNLKLDNLLENEDINILNSIFKTLFLKQPVSENKVLIGFYSSGGFLANLYNLFNKCNNHILHFKTFPFVDLHPLGFRELIKNKDLIIFDETIKTGFTFSLFKNMYLRVTKNELEKDNYNFLVIGENNTYKQHRKNIVYSNVIEYNKELTIEKVNIRNFLDNREDLSLLEESFKETKYYDFTLVLHNTDIYFAVVNKMVEQIIEKSNNQTISLFSPSHEGRVLMYGVAYLLKLENKTIAFDISKKETYQVIIDMTYNTGFTIRNSLLPLAINESELDNILVVYNLNKNNISNIYSVIGSI